MKQFSYTVKVPAGIHAVPAALLAQEARKYNSFITIAKGSSEKNMADLLKIMSMSVMQGDTVTVTIEGDDEDTAVKGLESFFQQYL